MKRNFRLLEIMVLSTWTMTFFIGYKPELIRAITVIIGMGVTVPKLYSGIVRRESPTNYPTLDSIIGNYSVVNLVASHKDLDCLEYPGVEALADPLATALVVPLSEYDSEMVVKGKTLLVWGGNTSDVPTVYLGSEAYKIANAPIKTSIPCIMVLPGSIRQIPLNIG
jgi:multisubunit Na+/H+ antiporter MnhC subunit